MKPRAHALALFVAVVASLCLLPLNAQQEEGSIIPPPAPDEATVAGAEEPSEAPAESPPEAPAESPPEAQQEEGSIIPPPAPGEATVAGAEEPSEAPAESPPDTDLAPTEKPAEPSETQARPEDFEIDRGGAGPEAAKEAVVEPRQSFWGRLFGRKGGKPATEAEAAKKALPEERTTGTAEPEGERAGEQQAEAAGAGQVGGGDTSREELLAMQEEVRRQAKEIEALKFLDQAYQAMGRGEFEVALKHFSEAINVMPKRPQTLEIREKARKKQAECAYRIALNYYRNGQIEEAKEAIKRALGYYPADRSAARLSERIRSDEARIIDIKTRPRHPKKTEEYLGKQEKLQAAIKLGRQYMEIHEYEKAKYEFRSVLIEDPFNEEAIANLKKIAEWQYDVETDRWNAMQQEMLADVRGAWSPPVKQEIKAPERIDEDLQPISPRRRLLLEKLNTIVIPELDFRMANVADVIQYLKQQSIAGDTKSPEGQRGVNIMLNLKRPGEVSAAEEPAPSVDADPFAPAAAPSASAAARSVPQITLSLSNILLIDAIKYITELTGLKSRIEDDVVVITPADVEYGKIVTRTYKVQPTITEIIMGGAPGGESGEGVVLDMGGEASRVQRGDVKTFFVEAGVPFREGTSIVYKPSINLLIVSNTEENLERFEKILNTLNVIPTQVEIEARFVEIGQRDLEELGVEWYLTDDWQIAQDVSAGAAAPLSARERLQVNKNAVTKGLRYLSSAGSGAAAGGDLAGIFSISSVLTNPELTFILHALEQRTGVNLLSAPKVTTKSGSNAEIKVVRELIYPTEFELSASTVSSGDAGIVTPSYVTPAAFETRDLGVVLNVTPTVGPDGYTIDLQMLPQVVELADWINYGSTIVNPDGTMEQMNMPQPIFHSRSIATSISIWDGQTVVMGGLITEGQTTTEDKIPFLGDIPLIGALFRSKTSNSEKRNLLIFVTARLVDPAGNRYHPETDESANP